MGEDFFFSCFCFAGSPLGGGWVRGRIEREAEDAQRLKPRECDTRAGQGIKHQRGGAVRATAQDRGAGVNALPLHEHTAQRL